NCAPAVFSRRFILTGRVFLVVCTFFRATQRAKDVKTELPASPRVEVNIAPPPAAAGSVPLRSQPAATPVIPTTNSQLVRWMFQFARPVMMLIFLACLYLALWVGAEVLAVRQTGQVVGHIQKIQHSDIAARGGFLAWVRGGEAEAVLLRHYVFVLAALTA